MKNIKVIIPVRDPRDVLVSGVFWRQNRYRRPADVENEDCMNRFGIGGLTQEHLDKWKAASFDERLMFQLDNTWPFPIGQILLEYDYQRLFTKRKNTLLIHFEDLIGKSGGGSDMRQTKAILQMAKFLEIPITEGKLAYVKKNLFGTSPTFRKGKIGAWKTHFKQEHIELFVERMGHLLMELGYENDNSWAIEFLREKGNRSL